MFDWWCVEKSSKYIRKYKLQQIFEKICVVNAIQKKVVSRARVPPLVRFQQTSDKNTFFL